jgi:hypothetical protein
VVNCVATVAGSAAAVLLVTNETQYFGRQKCHAKHYQFKGFDKSFARRGLGQIRVGTQPKRGHHCTQLTLMSQHGDTSCRIPLLEGLHLRECNIEIIADIDDEQDGLLLRERVRDQVVNAACRRENTKASRTQNPSEAFPQQRILPDKNGIRSCPIHGGPR